MLRREPGSSRGSGVMLTVLVLLFLIVALTGYLIGVYNGLVRVRAAVKLAWSNIDVLLVQRHDELPKLVEVCKQYLHYEAGTLERVMRARAGVDAARSSGSMSTLGGAERELRSGLTGLYAVAEKYPELKASEPFRHLQERISGLETAIADRREVYNDAVNTNNVRIDAFPDALIARLGDFPPAQLLHVQADRSEEHTLNSSHSQISYAVFCLKKKKTRDQLDDPFGGIRTPLSTADHV